MNASLVKQIINVEESFWQQYHSSAASFYLYRDIVYSDNGELVLIEWITDGARVSIALGGEPSWCIVSRGLLGGVEASGTFIGLNVKAMVNWLFSFIMECVK